jgi:hypothetical protein
MATAYVRTERHTKRRQIVFSASDSFKFTSAPTVDFCHRKMCVLSNMLDSVHHSNKSLKRDTYVSIFPNKARGDICGESLGDQNCIKKESV